MEAQFGKIIYDVGFNPLRQGWKAFVIVVLLGLALIISSVLLDKNSSAHESTTTTIFVVGLLLVVILLLSVALYSLVTTFSKKLQVYENGIVVNGKAWEWNEFDQITQRMLEDPNQRKTFPIRFFDLMLYKDNKKQVTINQDFKNYDQIMSYTIQHAGKPILEKLISRFDQGETLRFGKAELTHQTISDGKKTIQIKDIQSWHINYPDSPSMIRIEFTLKSGNSNMFIMFNERPNALLLPGFMEARGNQLINGS